MLKILQNISKRKLLREIREFIEYKKRFSTIKHYTHREILLRFAYHTGVKSYIQINKDTIESFVSKECNSYVGWQARITITAFIRYHAAKEKVLRRERQCEDQERTLLGRRPNVQTIAMVKRLKSEGLNGEKLSFRDIAKIMGKNLSLIHRWYHYPDKVLEVHRSKLSTGK